MKKLIIVSIIMGVAGPGIAFAGPIVPRASITDCIPQSVALAPGYVPVLRADGLGPVKGMCTGAKDELVRIYDLEVAVQALQTRNAQLEANNGATEAVPASIEARVSALEKVTKSIQDSLVMVVNMLVQVLNAIKK